MLVPDYRAFIEKHFYIKTKEGLLLPFKLNEVQLAYLQLLERTYPTMQGIRENVLKGRQFGISTLVSAIFVVDFILSAMGEIPLIDADIYSHKDSETDAHFARVNMFLESFMISHQGGDYTNSKHREDIKELRPKFLRTDTTNLLVAKNGTQIMTQTASAKVSGRGSTKQNIHWTEPAFYPNTDIMNAESLMTGAEEQVPQNFGKIFRESTGHTVGDYYALEYHRGKDGVSDFKSRFIAWYSFRQYQMPAPKNWQVPGYYRRLISVGKATIHQCYWHFMKTRGLTDKKKLREYPTYDREAFLAGGDLFFSNDALIHYSNEVMQPLKKGLYVSAL